MCIQHNNKPVAVQKRASIVSWPKALKKKHYIPRHYQAGDMYLTLHNEFKWSLIATPDTKKKLNYGRSCIRSKKI